MALHTLPNDILFHITRHLAVADTVALRLTHRNLAAAPIGPLGVTTDHAVRAVHVGALHALSDLFRHAPTPRALIHAAGAGDAAAATALLDLGADPSAHGSLALAAAAGSGARALPVLRLLLPRCDPAARGGAALRCAAAAGCEAGVRALLTAGGGRAGGDGAALHTAAAAGHAGVVRALVAAGCGEPAAGGGVALRHAARDGRLGVVCALVGCGGGARVREEALMEAAAAGRADVVAFLVCGGWVAGRSGREAARRVAEASAGGGGVGSVGRGRSGGTQVSLGVAGVRSGGARCGGDGAGGSSVEATATRPRMQ